MKETIRYGLILGLICFVASGILAVVNAFTDPKIKSQQEKEEKAALEAVMPQAVNFLPKEFNSQKYYLCYDSQKELSGFVIKAAGKGYSSDIEVMAGLDKNLNITDIKVVSQNETPGLGDRITKPAFKDQFKGKNSETLNQVDTISGSTISSSAVIKGIEDSLLALKTQLEKEAASGK